MKENKSFKRKIVLIIFRAVIDITTIFSQIYSLPRVRIKSIVPVQVDGLMQDVIVYALTKHVAVYGFVTRINNRTYNNKL